MQVPFVRLAPQNEALEAALTDAFQRVLRSGRYLMGSEVEACEKELQRWANGGTMVPFRAAGVGSGTDSCEVAIRAVGWGEGQTVATPAFGAVPTIAAIEAAGATPVLVDVDPITRGVSHATLAQAKTDGAVVVHMFGMPCDVPDWAIEDCAHAMGAAIMGRPVGTFGAAGAFSFFPTKCLGTLGDGGAIITRDPEVYARAVAIRHYGGLLTGDVEGRGQNSRLCELQAAFVRAKLPHLENWNRKRRELAAKYTAELKGHVTTPVDVPGRTPTYHVYVVEHEERDRIKAYLAARGIETLCHYPRSLHFYRRWRHLGAPGDFPVAERLSRTVLSLPLYPELSDEEQDIVVQAVKECT